MPKVSVIIPAYKVEKYLPQCLDSIVNQTLTDIEIIVIDDGSPDDSGRIIDEYAARDSRIIPIHKDNGGVSAARNDGIRKAVGEYLYIMDSDDWLELKALETLYEKAASEDADVVYFDWIREWPSGPKKVQSFPNAFVTDSPDTIEAIQCAVMGCSSFELNIARPEFSCVYHLGGAPWRCLIRRSIVRGKDLFFDPYVRGLGDDVIFMLNVFEGVKKLCYIQEYFYHWRIVDVSYTHGYNPDLLNTYGRIFERMEAFIRENRKDQRFVDFYYIRVLTYLRSAMKRYFINAKNPKGESDLKKEFALLAKSEPYATAIKGYPVKKVGSKKAVAEVCALKAKLYSVYWKLSVK